MQIKSNNPNFDSGPNNGGWSEKDLVKFAISGAEENIRCAAIEKINDEKDLIHIFRKSINKNVRMAAIQKITDQTFLESITKPGIPHDYEVKLKQSAKKVGLSVEKY